MVDVVRPSGNALGAPKGSANYLDKLESYATSLETEVASLYKGHTVIFVGVVCTVVGFVIGAVI